MVSFKSIITTSIVLFATLTNVQAAVSPTYPSPNTTQIEGQQYSITWTSDGKNATQTYQIDFMTGSNDNQTVLSTIATGVKATALSYTYTAPYVTPNSAIYFFMFTGSQGDVAWTTRFGIAPAGGSLTTEPEQTQPSGEAIPWGQGALAAAAASVSAVASSTAASVAVTPAAASNSVVATVSPSVAAPVSSTAVAQVAASATSGTTMVKPVLGFVSVAIAGYLSL